MGRIPEEKIQEIKDRIDIVEVVSSYLPLKRSGVNNQGLCPFHQEKSPSFNVNSARKIFHCFVCGVGGNVFSFLMRMEGLSFPDAVKRLGEKVGVEVAEEEVSPAEIHRRESRERLARINEVAGQFYHQLLLEDEAGAHGRRYLRQRGYAGETVRAFQVGFAPEGWETLSKHLAGKNFSAEDIRKTGLVRPGKQGRGDYDLFRNRLLFPIHDLQGRMVAFGGRVLDDSLPKYINSPETEIYHKGQVLYGDISFWDTEPEQRDEIMKNIGILYQSGALWSSMTLAENITLPLGEYTDLNPTQMREIASLKLALVGLAGFEDYYPSEISGGMRKRAGLARAMALDPEVLFFDEPSAGLDPISASLLDELILELRDSLGATIIVVTHELASIFAIGNNSVFLDPDTKTMIAAGDPKKLRDESYNSKVRKFLTRGEG